MTDLSASAQKVQHALNKYDIELKVVRFAETTKTSQDAAKLIGCDLAQIAKTIIFKGKNSGNPICIIASGIHRINEKKIEEYIGEPLEKATPDFVLEKTGFVIGGVPPIGHSQPLTIFIDQDLQNYESLWAAAGNPHAVFKLTPQELIKITNGKVISVI
jgi:prolyl-tRNA editing enzyme YbaK/EbsC (Cys-tRNA(Pro) deacylase)